MNRSASHMSSVEIPRIILTIATCTTRSISQTPVSSQYFSPRQQEKHTMSKLPPVEKLSLAVRKNLRDEWEQKKEGLEKQLSDILTVPWTVDLDPKQIYAYADDGYAKDSLGACITAYIEGAIWKLKYFVERFGDEGVKELNAICHKHSMGLDVDETSRFSYCGVDVLDGQLRLLFEPKCLGTNIDYCLDEAVLEKALNEAPAAEGSDSKLSYSARADIRREYEPKIGDIQKKVAELLANPDIKLNPNFDALYASLLAESKVKKTELREDWQKSIGYLAREYFDGLVSQLNWQKFEDDEMLQEGFKEVVDKNEIALRIVDKLKDSSYCEAVVEDGILWLQCKPTTWGTNISYAAEKLVDKL
ncbi:uncharacterized protein B0I36DRAFT_335691 [Microdochium trichocladiopsis]|uniref:Uncharacterized protein n=1 Tax=Microdochium trichocladiopsis TaxID=1682393 RepID=A0A9P8XXJ4_9PEZI|nr:uncharacterized protein B0I36DRAFT_335691 [Microdochium trichocladiopsis]KAH7018298.1 hypothetical protein B0I36DRAFT_335691 [Microdochium trichocladiopsis]